jgi:hypothetical protein
LKIAIIVKVSDEFGFWGQNSILTRLRDGVCTDQLNLENPKSETLMAATMNAFGVAKAVRLPRLLKKQRSNFSYIRVIGDICG